ncbi:class 1 isoprenoid biosynthesis enzyme [Lacticigenium naphthae]|uniref:class 1 isoprenoid biosynthesis enzyme n=1 Tax=Lacticigenium naphthae TaxID=515351 RepID=UPI000425932C|nr:class 1 isoprenoid biosynthesis enzyme [Lacticigenium naphthae]
MKKSILHTIPINKLIESSILSYQKERRFPSEKLKTVSIWKKLWNERQLKKILNKLLDEQKPYVPELREYFEAPFNSSSSAVKEVKSLLIQALQKMDTRKLLFDQPFLYYFITQGYMDVAEEFLHRAKKEDSHLSSEEIFQALRNVWIMNSLQLYWNNPLSLTAPMYAYSMLYPYTDNLLDDSNVNDRTKQVFNYRLGKVLTGETVSSNQITEKRIFSLVEEIRCHYPIKTNPEVMESVQLIHKAQVESLLQGKDEPLTEREILTISFYKGGTSVLADAYLIKGTLTKEEMQFAFQYGVFLQLLDDLQDKKEDEENHSQTLFSTKRTQESIDREIRSLISYIYFVNSENGLDKQNTILMKQVISQCTLLVVVEAIGKNPDIVTRSMYKELESYSKVRLKFYKELENKMKEFLEQ